MSAKNLARIFLIVFIPVGLVVSTRSLTHAPASNAAWGMALAWAALQALFIWLAVRRHPGRPANRWFWWAGLIAGMAGGIAIPSNGAISSLQSAFDWPEWVAALLTPSAEETAKGLAVLFVAIGCVKVRRPIEATVLGIVVGGGFSIMENISYITQTALQSLTSDVDGALTGYLGRALACPFSHSMYAGILAWGIGCFISRTDKDLGWRVRKLVTWFALGYAVHAAYNALPAFVASFNPDAQGLALVGATALQWILVIWLYIRSRKIGRRQEPVGTLAG